MDKSKKAQEAEEIQKAYGREQKLYNEEFDDLLKNKYEQDRNISDLLLKNIGYLRSFHLQLVALSLVALGAVVTILVSDIQEISVYKPALYISLLLLSFNITMSVFCLHRLLVGEHNNLVRIREGYRESFEKEIARLFEYASQGKVFEEYSRAHIEAVKKYAKEEVQRRNSKGIGLVVELLPYTFIGGITAILVAFMPELIEVFLAL